MNNHKIIPEKVTWTLQLFADWLSGLDLIDETPF